MASSLLPGVTGPTSESPNTMRTIPGSTARAAASLFLAAASMPLAAQTTASYPSKPVRIVVGYAPGGPSDVAARVVAPSLSELLGQPVVIENRGGAGGVIGMEVVAKAPADGYTISLGASGNMVMAPHLYPKISYNILKDLQPVSTLVVSAYVVAINPTVPANTVGEFAKLVRNAKVPLTYGTSGAGSASHIAAELFAGALGAKFTHVPYKGTAPSLTGLAAGEIDMMIADLIPAQPLAQAKRLRLLATVGSKRASAAPELPTVAEAGLKMPAVDGRYGLLVPAGTPKEIVTKLHTAIMTALKSNDVRQRYQQMGLDIIGDTPEQFLNTLRTEGEVFGAVIRKAGIKAE